MPLDRTECVMTKIVIATDFSRFPIGRYRRHGTESGEAFREDFLVPSLKSEDSVTVVLDGTSGYPSSFLEEAFGGLVRTGFSLLELQSKLKLVATDPAYTVYKDDAWQFIKDAENDREKV